MTQTTSVVSFAKECFDRVLSGMQHMPECYGRFLPNSTFLTPQVNASISQALTHIQGMSTADSATYLASVRDRMNGTTDEILSVLDQMTDSEDDTEYHLKDLALALHNQMLILGTLAKLAEFYRI